MRSVIILLALPAALIAREIHVAPGGRDANPGTAANPLATIAAAQRAARAAAAREPATVFLDRLWRVGATRDNHGASDERRTPEPRVAVHEHTAGERMPKAQRHGMWT